MGFFRRKRAHAEGSRQFVSSPTRESGREAFNGLGEVGLVVEEEEWAQQWMDALALGVDVATATTLHKEILEATEENIAALKDCLVLGRLVDDLHKEMIRIRDSRAAAESGELPAEEEELSMMLMKCIMGVLNKKLLLAPDEVDDIVPRLVVIGAISHAPYVKWSIMRVLAVVCNGSLIEPVVGKAVTNALDNWHPQDCRRRGRSAVLRSCDAAMWELNLPRIFWNFVDTLADPEENITVKSDTMVFINVLLQSADTYNERVMLRREFLELGILEALNGITDQFTEHTSDDGGETDTDDLLLSSDRPRSLRRIQINGAHRAQVAFHGHAAHPVSEKDVKEDLLTQINSFFALFQQDSGEDTALLSTVTSVITESPLSQLAKKTIEAANAHPVNEGHLTKILETLVSKAGEDGIVWGRIRDAAERAAVGVELADLVQPQLQKLGQSSVLASMMTGAHQKLNQELVRQLSQSGLCIREDPRFAPYFLMLKRGMPRIAVESKMAQAGLDISVLDTPDATSSNSAPATGISGAVPVVIPAANDSAMDQAEEADDEPEEPDIPADPEKEALRDSPGYARFFMMYSQGESKENVMKKMEAKGLDVSVFTTYARPPKKKKVRAPLSGGSPALLMGTGASSESMTSSSGELCLRDDPRYAKYFKLLKLGKPKEAIQADMIAEKIDPEILDMDPSKPLPPPVPLKEDPKYKKYFHLLLVIRAPKINLQREMAAQGLDPDVLDLDPNKPKPFVPPKAKAAMSLVTLKSKRKQPKWRWSKVDSKDTYFNHINPEGFKFNAAKFDTEFPDTVSTPKSAKTEPEKSASNDKMSGSKKSLFDPKAAFNADIACKKLKMAPDRLHDLLLEMDVYTIIKMIDQLRIFEPKDNMIQRQLEVNKGQTDGFDIASTYLVVLNKLPMFKKRLDFITYASGFAGDAEAATVHITTFRLALTQIATSEKLRVTFEALLAIGNHINKDTDQGDARAVSASKLLTPFLANSTHSKGKTLLDVFVEWATEALKTGDLRTNVLKLKDDLSLAPQMATKNFTEYTDLVKTLNAHVKEAKDILSSLPPALPKNDRLREVVSLFHEQASKTLETVNSLYKSTLDEYLRLAASLIIEVKADDGTFMHSGECFFKVFDTYLMKLDVAVVRVEQAEILRLKKLKADGRKKELARLSQPDDGVGNVTMAFKDIQKKRAEEGVALSKSGVSIMERQKTMEAFHIPFGSTVGGLGTSAYMSRAGGTQIRGFKMMSVRESEALDALNA